MKKKKITLKLVLILLLVASFVLVFYFFRNNDNDEKKKSISENSESVNENNNKLFSYSSGMEIIDLKNNYTYTGDDITLTVCINNDGDQFDETFLLFVNGMQNTYHTDRSNKDLVYHTITVPAKESVTVKIFFKPQNCKVGETVFISLERMMNMNYMLPDTSYVNFYPNHEINGIMPFKMKISDSCTENDKISIDNSKSWKTVELTKEIIEDNIVCNEKGNPTSESYLDDNSYFDLYQNERLDSYFTAQDHKINLTLDAYGKSGLYRVGVYVDHVLQPAFNGKYYSDVEVKREKISSQSIEIDLSGLKGLHCIYAIAVPIEDNKLFTVKTPSRILSMENTEKKSNTSYTNNDSSENNSEGVNSDNKPINNISNMTDIGDNYILLTNGNKGITYNIDNNKYSSKSVDINGGDTIQAVESGFAVIGMNGAYINIYDKQCKLTDKITPPQHDCGVYAVAYDKKRIAYSYSDENGNTYVYTDNINLTDKKLVSKYDMSEKLNTIQGITDIYSYKNEVISFSGSVLTQNNPQNFSSCMGTVNEESKKTSFYTINKGYYLSANLSPQINFFVEIQDFNMDKSASGVINYSPYSEINVKSFKCKANEESHYAAISENGQYISTLTDTPGKLRIYNLKTNELLNESNIDAIARNVILNEKNKTVYYIDKNGIKKFKF